VEFEEVEFVGGGAPIYKHAWSVHPVSGRVYVSGGSFSPPVSIRKWVVSMDRYFRPLSDGANPEIVILRPRRYFPPFLSSPSVRLVSSVLRCSHYPYPSANSVVSLNSYFPTISTDIILFAVSCTLVLFFSIFLITTCDWSIFVLVVCWSWEGPFYMCVCVCVTSVPLYNSSKKYCFRPFTGGMMKTIIKRIQNKTILVQKCISLYVIWCLLKCTNATYLSSPTILKIVPWKKYFRTKQITFKFRTKK
jgi:hypothetical protein